VARPLSIAPEFPADTLLVIGVGNEYAHDDAAGLMVARKLKERAPNNMKIVESAGDGASLMEAWNGANSVIVIDAVRSGAEVGKVHLFNAQETPLPTQPFHGSTHAFGLHQAVELARALDQLPKQFLVYGIEGENFTAGIGVSSAVDRASETIVPLILAMLR
jgi:hydrogenase maturation protease